VDVGRRKIAESNGRRPNEDQFGRGQARQNAVEHCGHAGVSEAPAEQTRGDRSPAQLSGPGQARLGRPGEQTGSIPSNGRLSRSKVVGIGRRVEWRSNRFDAMG